MYGTVEAMAAASAGARRHEVVEFVVSHAVQSVGG